MADDRTLAFEHPEARARASPPEQAHDRISLRDHVRDADIGAFQSERGRPQRLSFDVVVEVATDGGAASDDVDSILSYDTITEAIDTALAAERVDLLETLAERVAAGILAEPQALRTFVRIEKLDRGPGRLGVEIVRTPGSVPAEFAHHQTPRPVILFLPPGSLDIAGPLDAAEGDGPVVVATGAGPAEAPPVHPMAQRRIDLLAIEQSCWRLAAADRRCVVVSSRTELDWAMGQGQTTVWAPSRMVLNAAEPPRIDRDGRGLARWLAEELNAIGTLGL